MVLRFSTSCYGCHQLARDLGVSRLVSTIHIESKLYPELEKRLERASPDKSIVKQGIKVKFADFQLTTIEHIHPQLELDDFRLLLKDILKRQQGREIRLLGLNVTLKPELQARQLSFF